jgi:KipI family sensor histidine kinase inhibitor
LKNGFRVTAAGDSVLIAEFEDRIETRINAQAIQLAAAVERAQLPGIRDVVPTYRSVAVYFDPLRTDFGRLDDLLLHEGRRALESADAARPAPGDATVQIPVRYGGEDGPDLDVVARFAHMSDVEVVRRHTARVYRVFMMGFLPGFPYMGIVDETIAAPRKNTPRVRVPAGSVGIAGAQTGIYPADTPGGWQLIGRTSLKLFDAARSDPFLLKPGDAVQFVEER